MATRPGPGGRGLRPGAAGRPSPGQPGTVAFGVAVAAAGIGSVDYHGPGSPAARLLHDGGLYAVVGLVAWHELTRRAGRSRRTRSGRVAYRAALAATAAGAACWWVGRTASPWCAPDSLLQGHAAWHLLGAAALAADGESVIGNIGQIDRGYERIDERLRSLGANIDRTG